MKATQIAIWSFILLTLLAFFEIELVRNRWALVALELIPFSIILMLILSGFTLEAVFVGARKAGNWAGALREVLAIPLAVLLVIVAYEPVRNFGIDVFAGRYLHTHRSEMARMEQRAGPSQPAAIPYFDGAADSGISIFHSEGGSMLRVSEEAGDLVDAPINWCRALEPSYYVCSHGNDGA